MLFQVLYHLEPDNQQILLVLKLPPSLSPAFQLQTRDDIPHLMTFMKLNLCLRSARVRLEKLREENYFCLQAGCEWQAVMKSVGEAEPGGQKNTLNSSFRHTHRGRAGRGGHPAITASLAILAQEGSNYGQEATLASPFPNFWVLFNLTHTLSALLFVVNSFYIKALQKQQEHSASNRTHSDILDRVVRDRKLRPASIGHSSRNRFLFSSS